jgi:dethiobiotin synthetase
MLHQYFVTAIGTDSGKTFVSAILTEALQATYWKPIQSGLPRDTEKVQSLVSPHLTFLPEKYLLTQPLSPHAAAAIDGVQIAINTIQIPPNTGNLIVEGAGGILVPINQEHFVIDLAAQLQLPIIVVANLYLGSINHTLLTIKELERREAQGLIKIKGLVFNGVANPASEEIILHHSPYPFLFRVNQEEAITPATVKKYAEIVKTVL